MKVTGKEFRVRTQEEVDELVAQNEAYANSFDLDCPLTIEQKWDIVLKVWEEAKKFYQEEEC